MPTTDLVASRYCGGSLWAVRAVALVAVVALVQLPAVRDAVAQSGPDGKKTSPAPPSGGQAKPIDTGGGCPEDSNEIKTVRISIRVLKSAADAAETSAKADEAYWLRALHERGPNDPETVAAAELKEKSATAAAKARQALQAAEDRLAGLQGKVCPRPGGAVAPGGAGAAQPTPRCRTPAEEAEISKLREEIRLVGNVEFLKLRLHYLQSLGPCPPPAASPVETPPQLKLLGLNQCFTPDSGGGPVRC